MNNDENIKGTVPSKPAALCILIVNDDEDALFLLSRGIGRAFPNASLPTARNGNEALTIWKNQTVHAVVTDNRMPLMTGMMLTRKIRETDLLLPIIMITGSIQDRDEALAAGVTEFNADPNLDGVIAPLRSCLAHRDADKMRLDDPGT